MRLIVFTCLFLFGCGGTEATSITQTGPAPEEHEETRAETPDPGEELPAATDAPARVNLSAGPATAGAALVPQHGLRDVVSALAVLPGIARGVAGTQSGGLVVVFDIPSGRIRASKRCFRGSILDIQPNADGSRLLIEGSNYYGAEEPRIGVWDLRNDTFRRIDVAGVEANVASAAISPDGDRVAFVEHRYTGDGDESFLHIAPTSGVGATHRRAVGDASTVYFSHDGATLAVVHDGGVEMRDGTTGVRRASLDVAASPRTATFHPTQTLLAVATSRDGVKVIDARARVRAEFAIQTSELAFDSTGDSLAVCSGTRLLVRSGENYGEQTDPALACRAGSRIDFRAEPMVADIGSTLQVRRVGAPLLEVRTDEDIHSVAFPHARGTYFLVGGRESVHIYNTSRERQRRLLRGGAGERSAWHVARGAGGFQLVGRGWAQEFGAPSETAEPSDSFPTVRGEHIVLSTSPDRQARIVITDPYEDMNPKLLRVGVTRIASLSQPRGGFGNYCGVDEDGDGEPFCTGRVQWGPDNRFMIAGNEVAASYDQNGRRQAVSENVLDVQYTADGTRMLVRNRDASMTITDLRFRRQARIFNARRGVQAKATIDESGELIAATRGRVLQIIDVASGEQRHNITLNAIATEAPIIRDSQVQLRFREGFVWYSTENGSETRRVDVDDIRVLDDAVTQALHCAEGRLLFRNLADAQSVDLAPCPPRGKMGFDDEFVWWVEGNSGRVLRRSDGQQLTLRSLNMRRHRMGIAYTPQGHLFLSRTNAMGELLLRGPGPVLTAAIARPTSELLSPNLITDFMAGRELGPAPSVPRTD